MSNQSCCKSRRTVSLATDSATSPLFLRLGQTTRTMGQVVQVEHRSVVMALRGTPSQSRPAKTSAGMLLISEGKLLLLKRSKNVRNPGKWGLPGGQRDGSESSWQTAVRESTEELGGLPLSEVFGEISVRRGRKRYVIFVARVSRKGRKRFTPRLNTEHTQSKWVTLQWCTRKLHKLHPIIREILSAKKTRKEIQRALDGSQLRSSKGRTQRAKITVRAA